jgi:hypothetical protein
MSKRSTEGCERVLHSLFFGHSLGLAWFFGAVIQRKKKEKKNFSIVL